MTLFDDGYARTTDPWTSHDAAHNHATCEDEILALLMAHLSGLTDDELAYRLPHRHGPTVKTARSRLVGSQQVSATGDVRMSLRNRPMLVWALATRYRDVL